MFIKIKYQKNAILYVEAKGKLDIYNAQDYLDEIRSRINNITKELVLDFSNISYVASIGLRVILDLYKIMQEKGCQVKLKNVNEDILHTFEITGFDKFLIIENDSEDDSKNA